MKILLPIFIFSLIALSGFLFWKNLQFEVNPTGNWDAFINSEFNVSFKYPSEYSSKEPIIDKTFGINSYWFEKGENTLGLSIEYNKKLDTLDQYLANRYEGSLYKVIEITKKEIAGNQWNVISQKYFDKTDVSYEYLLLKNGVAYAFYLPQAISDQLLETVKIGLMPSRVAGKYSDAVLSFNYPIGWATKGDIHFGSNSGDYYDLTVKIVENLNPLTNDPYKNLNEFLGLSYEIRKIIVDGHTGLQPLPRAGSENQYLVVVFSRDLKHVVQFDLIGPEDPIRENELKKVFNDLIESVKFAEIDTSKLDLKTIVGNIEYNSKTQSYFINDSAGFPVTDMSGQGKLITRLPIVIKNELVRNILVKVVGTRPTVQGVFNYNSESPVFELYNIK